MSARLEHALKKLSDALGTLESSVAELPAMPASECDHDNLKQHIQDIEAMMAEAIALLEQTSPGDA
jgi:hypothetical protein